MSKIDNLIDKAYEMEDKLEQDIYNRYIESLAMLSKAYGFLIQKIFLRNYFFQMQMYELKHGDQDDPSRRRK